MREAPTAGARWAAATLGAVALLALAAAILLLMEPDRPRSGGFRAQGEENAGGPDLPVSASPADTATRTALAVGWDGGTVCYEIFVRSFQDSDDDGVGDLQGLLDRLDYVNDGDPDGGEDLGADCIWLMPTFPSPSYHGYDVTDYTAVNPELGTLDDLRAFLTAAHARGVRVLLDLVINHTSDRHPWFVDALSGAGATHRDWYRFSDVTGPDNEYGDNNRRPTPSGEEFYYGFFSPRMPDLDWDHPAVRREMERIADFWLLEVGVDGFRLDAVRHLMEDQDGTSTNVPRTHDMLRELGRHVRSVQPSAFTVGEVFDSTGALVPYYPDQLDSFFAFQVANAIVDAARTGSNRRLLAAVDEAREEIPGHRWSTFIRNHDQTRALTELGGDVGRARVAASLLLTLPGIPFVYYGEEIGMTGDKPDRRLRTPMHWERRPGGGFTGGEPWEPLQADSARATVAGQSSDPNSLLSHYRRLIHLRTADPALGRGEWVPLDAGTDGVAAYLRRTAAEAVLVAVNLRGEPTGPLALSGSRESLPPAAYRMERVAGFTPNGPTVGPYTASEAGISGWEIPSIGGYGTVILRVLPDR
ncbi:MAG: alpha-amylase family glycosyl hydrolase [Gemmatimonadota bacterium]